MDVVFALCVIFPFFLFCFCFACGCPIAWPVIIRFGAFGWSFGVYARGMIFIEADSLFSVHSEPDIQFGFFRCCYSRYRLPTCVPRAFCISC